jgi:small-conductance mechanosensitive channel
MDIKTTRQLKNENQKLDVPGKGKHHLWFTTYVIAAIACLVTYFLLRFRVFDLLGTYRQTFQHLALAGFFVFLVLMATKGIELLLIKRSHVKSAKYNLVRLIHLLSVVIAALIIISFLFENWYTAAVSLGLFSLILGFALQTPISSLIGWFYIIIRSPYKVGDRIQVGDFTGDVVEISYLDTTLWEFGGDYQSNDLPSGRLIRFPNTLVFQSPVYNYSWKKFPYIWNEIPFHVAYESDLNFVETTIRAIAQEQLGPQMAENIKVFKEIVEQTPVDELEIKEYPFVSYRINANTWVEVLLIYLVEPKKASAVRSRLIKAILPALLKEPDKVLFPKGNNR